MNPPVILTGRVEEILAALPSSSFHAIVCDPPYFLEFMGSDWDTPGRGDARGLVDTATWGGVTGAGQFARAGVRYGGTQAYGADAVALGRSMQAWHFGWLKEGLRILKPGGFLVAFSGSRTYHRLACAAEEAGFEVRDMIEWFYGGGYPKSRNLSVAIDSALGASREVIGRRWEGRYPNGPGGSSFGVGTGQDGTRTADRDVVTRAATPEAAEWEGWGTALKPAHEPILLARRPLEGTYAANVMKHGAGGMNIQAVREKTDDALGGGAERAGNHEQGVRHEGWERPWQADEGQREAAAARVRAGVAEAEEHGRWPANLLFAHGDDCLLLGTKIVQNDGHYPASSDPSMFQGRGYDDEESIGFGEQVVGVWDCQPGCPAAALDQRSPSPGASRFYYAPKTSRAEREAGLEDFDLRPLYWSSGEQNPGSFQSEGTDKLVQNDHPTVKPIQVMRWLVKLVVPEGGMCLDPFLGSGTTAIAGWLEGVDVVGVEQQPEFVAIAEARLRFWMEHGERGFELASRRHSGTRRRRKAAAGGQLDIFAVSDQGQ